MQKKPLIMGSIIAVVILVLASFPSVVGYQSTRTTSRLKMENLISRIKEKTTLQNKKNVDNYQLITSSLISSLKKRTTQPLIFSKLILLYLFVALLFYPFWLVVWIVSDTSRPFFSALILSLNWLQLIILVLVFYWLDVDGPIPLTIIQNMKSRGVKIK